MNRIFYHKMDLDGKCSGAIAKIYFDQKNESCTLHPYNYDMPFPADEMSKEDNIYFLDVSIQPYSEMHKLIDDGWDITICDHHKSFLESGVHLRSKGNCSLEKAGCELTWQYFFPNDTCPQFVRLLGRYDIWDKYNSDWDLTILPFQWSMKNRDTDLINNFEIWQKLWNDKNDNHLVEQITEEGAVVLEYQKRSYKNALRSYGFEATLEDYPDIRLLCMNGPGGNSMMFEDQWDEDRHDAMFVWCCKGSQTICSLYTAKKLDLTQIATNYGGGGHAQACGFQVKNVRIDGKIIRLER